VNNLRGNLPIGTVDHPTYTSTSNSKVGPCSSPGSSGNCFEPGDMFKGAVARAYFYISTCYMNQWDCCSTEGTDKSDIKPWMAQQLLQWHLKYPANSAEKQINDEIFEKYQQNRNPFVDHPEWAVKIWPPL